MRAGFSAFDRRRRLASTLALLVAATCPAATAQSQLDTHPPADPVIEEPIRPIGLPTGATPAPPNSGCGRIGWLALPALWLLGVAPASLRR